MRLDAQLAKLFPNYSRSQLQQFIADGRVTVNGEVVTKSSFLVGDDDLVLFNEPTKPDFSRELGEFEKHVIYIDDNVVVINKPAGVLVHAKGGTDYEFTVADYVKSIFNVGELAQSTGNNRLGIVHRLDRATSGVIICARNLNTASMLSRQFAERKTKKTYLITPESSNPLIPSFIFYNEYPEVCDTHTYLISQPTRLVLFWKEAVYKMLEEQEKKDPKVDQLYEGLTEDSNPVLFLFTVNEKL